MTASNIQYEIADRTRATAHGGIGAMHLLVRKLGLDQAIDRQLGLLKIHLPCHDSDHVLNIAYIAWDPFESSHRTVPGLQPNGTLNSPHRFTRYTPLNAVLFRFNIPVVS